jgi:hypothetical protein
MKKFCDQQVRQSNTLELQDKQKHIEQQQQQQQQQQ